MYYYERIQGFHCLERGCDCDEAQVGLFLCLESKVPILGESVYDETRSLTGGRKADKAG